LRRWGSPWPRSTWTERCTTSEELLADLTASLADGTMPKRVRYWSRYELLIIDGFGFDRIEREQTPQALNLLYKVIDRRCTRYSTALITYIDFED
jgi:DNA replication protein DnaC